MYIAWRLTEKLQQFDRRSNCGCRATVHTLRLCVYVTSGHIAISLLLHQHFDAPSILPLAQPVRSVTRSYRKHSTNESDGFTECRCCRDRLPTSCMRSVPQDDDFHIYVMPFSFLFENQTEMVVFFCVSLFAVFGVVIRSLDRL